MEDQTLLENQLKNQLAGTEAASSADGAPSSAVRPEPLTIVVPAYNEEGAIAAQLESIFEAMKGVDREFEVVVVDDGSTDATVAACEPFDVRMLSRERNVGYGAALKYGIEHASHDLILIIDADGTYPADAIPTLLEKAADYDMVVGARMSWKNVPVIRRPAKAFLRRLASRLAEQDIPDLNSGLRVFRKSVVEKYKHILPAGFSFTTTITLSFICNEHSVHFEPIVYGKRVGRSKIRPSDALAFLIIVVRTVTLFNPLRVFLPLGLVPLVGGSVKMIYDLASLNISDGALMGILSGLIIWSVGILADITSRSVLTLHRR